GPPKPNKRCAAFRVRLPFRAMAARRPGDRRTGSIAWPAPWRGVRRADHATEHRRIATGTTRRKGVERESKDEKRTGQRPPHRAMVRAHAGPGELQHAVPLVGFRRMAGG